MPRTQDTQLALLLSRLEILSQEAIDKALGIQAKAEEEGKTLALAAILVREGFLPYGLVERLVAHQADTQLTCKPCGATRGAKSLDPRDAFLCPTCQKALTFPEEDAALTALETVVRDPAAEVSRPSLIGRVLGGCRLERKIGEGGMGAVYEATQESLHRTVAVKVLPEYHIHQAGFVERFLRESRSAAQVIHPNVVQVMDAGRDGELHYIIMEFVEGRSLYDILQEEGRIPVRQALEYARQAALGLSAAAERDIIHRDVKPDNIRVNPKNVAKVADFGLAKDVQTSTQVTMTGAVVGTPLYMSPEQARGEQAGFRSDIYSLGATLHHLITGSPPFTGKSAMAILEKHTRDEPPSVADLVEDCPPEVDVLIRKMMAKRPEDRFDSYGDLVEAIEEIVGRATTLRETVVRPPVQVKKPVRALPIVVVVVILALAGVFLLTRDGGEPPSDVDVMGERGESGETEIGETEEGPPDVTPPPDVVEPPPPLPATLEITSDPEGATVIFDGEVIGKTPLPITERPAGEGILRVEMDGYGAHEEPVSLVAGETFSRSFALRRIVGSVRVTSTPGGASLFLDGEPRGETPADLEDVPPGPHEIRVESKGYRPATRQIDVTGGERTEEAVVLEPLPASLKIVTTPPGARIRLDGVYVGKSPLELQDLAAGSHALEAELPYHETETWEMDLPPGEAVDHQLEMSRPAEVVAFLGGVSEAEALLGNGFRLRAWDRINRLLETVGFPKDLRPEERDQARRLVSKAGGEGPSLEMGIRFGDGEGPTIESTATLPSDPASVGDLAGEAGTFTIRVPRPSDDTVRCCVLQVSVGAELAFRLLPDEARRAAPGAAIRRLTGEWSETYRRQKGDVHLFVLLASPSDIPLADIDAMKSRLLSEGGVDPVARGRDVAKAIEEWLGARELDFSLRFLWIDERVEQERRR